MASTATVTRRPNRKPVVVPPKPAPKLIVGDGAPWWDLGNPHQAMYLPKAS